MEPFALQSPKPAAISSKSATDHRLAPRLHPRRDVHLRGAYRCEPGFDTDSRRDSRRATPSVPELNRSMYRGATCRELSNATISSSVAAGRHLAAGRGDRRLAAEKRRHGRLLAPAQAGAGAHLVGDLADLGVDAWQIVAGRGEEGARRLQEIGRASAGVTDQIDAVVDRDALDDRLEVLRR